MNTKEKEDEEKNGFLGLTNIPESSSYDEVNDNMDSSTDGNAP